MVLAAKTERGSKTILKNINLCFYPGAKIGVVGGNGSGKSSLLKIMAGVDTSFTGTAVPCPGMSVGYLPQEPVLEVRFLRMCVYVRYNKAFFLLCCMICYTFSVPKISLLPLETRF